MVIIDPGHGGTDPGGGSNKYWLEKNMNLDISLYQYNRLKQLGIPVTLTRSTDITLDPTTRIATIKNIPYNSNEKNILISNHINVDYGNLDGAEVIYSIDNKDTLSRLIASNLSTQGQNLSSNGIYTRTGSNGKDYYYIIRDTKPYESIIVEYGFADSPGNDVDLLLNNRYALAEAVVKSIAEYLGYKYEGQTTNYTVVKGDTLYLIALKNNTTVSELKKLNNLTSDNLSIGQKLLIPVSFNKTNVISYKVQKNDSLYKIAQTFNTTVNTIKEANSLVSDLIYVNQILSIPVKDLTTYTVVKNDSLYEIGKKYGVSVDFIKLVNNLTSNTIYVGQKLLV